MTMTGTATMIVTKTMIMTMVAIQKFNKNFQTSSTRQFLLLAQNSICTFSLKIDAFLITQPTNIIG